jgi:SAM-dependent methyltransferase
MTMSRSANQTKRIVRQGYGKIARTSGSCCGPSKCSCGGASRPETVSRKIGYRKKEMDAVPEGANLGLGCGNPTALASLRKGETVLDLGSGAGFDAFLSANRVGPTGKVIGVDMTPEMIAKARRNAKKDGYRNVEFRRGDIENLPVDDDSVDAIVSNCVINLVPDKRRAFQEAFRVLKPGGRMFVSDLVLTRPLPARVLKASSALVGCIAGAWRKDKYLAAVRAAGFKRVRVPVQTHFPTGFITDFDVEGRITRGEAAALAKTVLSINVTGVKPARRAGAKS